MVIFQKFINREDLEANRNVLYLFGDNLERVGYGGQARHMRGEPNAVGVATKVAPGMREEDFFSDNMAVAALAIIENDLIPAFEHAKKGGIIVIPYDGLGTGLSELPTRAPYIYDYLVKRLADLASI